MVSVAEHEVRHAWQWSGVVQVQARLAGGLSGHRTILSSLLMLIILPRGVALLSNTGLYFYHRPPG